MKPKKHKMNKWMPPKDAFMYFDPHYDDDFKKKHPIGYVLVVITIFVIVLAPMCGFVCLGDLLTAEDANQFVCMLGVIPGLIASGAVSVGLCNLFMIPFHQYLGHWVTIISIVGGVLVDAVCLFIISLA